MVGRPIDTSPCVFPTIATSRNCLAGRSLAGSVPARGPERAVVQSPRYLSTPALAASMGTYPTTTRVVWLARYHALRKQASVSGDAAATVVALPTVKR